MDKILCISPLYNKRQFLPYTLGSVLLQKDVDVTLVIVDDCSTDGSYEWIMENLSPYPNVHIIRNEQNVGCYQSRNRGLKYAIDNNIEFDWYSVTDPDDQLFENRFIDTISSLSLSNLPNALFVKQAYHRVHLNGTYIEQSGAGEGCAMIKREVFDLIGYWDNTLRFGGDTEYMFRLGNHLRFNGLEDTMGNYIVTNKAPLLYALCDDTGQNLTTLHPTDSPERQAVYHYINGFTTYANLNDCYYGFDNTGHSYPSVGVAQKRD